MVSWPIFGYRMSPNSTDGPRPANLATLPCHHDWAGPRRSATASRKFAEPNRLRASKRKTPAVEPIETGVSRNSGTPATITHTSRSQNTNWNHPTTRPGASAPMVISTNANSISKTASAQRQARPNPVEGESELLPGFLSRLATKAIEQPVNRIPGRQHHGREAGRGKSGTHTPMPGGPLVEPPDQESADQ